MAKNLNQSLEVRFQTFFQLTIENKEAMAAAVLHPFYKLRWLPENTDDSKEKEIIGMVVQCTEEACLIPDDMEESCDSDEFLVLRSTRHDKKSIRQEVELYLADNDKSLERLHLFPDVKKAFIRYGTHLCSSAPVERFFSLAGFTFVPTRRSMSDKTFEMMTVLKGNSQFKVSTSSYNIIYTHGQFRSK